MFPFHLVQCANPAFLFLKRHWILNKLSKCAICNYWMCVSEDTSAVKTDWENVQMWVIVKTWCFYSFTMNSQSKQKHFSTLFLQNLPRKTRYEIWLHGGLFELELLQIFATAFLLKTYLNLNFVLSTAECSPFKWKKNLKKDASHLEIAWHSKRQNKNIEKRERKMKNKKKSNNNKYFYTWSCRHRTSTQNIWQ